MSARLRRTLAALGAIALGAGGLLLAGAASPALAFTGTCATTVPAATLVADGVCEVRFVAYGTFTPPVGVTKVAAVLVGGGGGGASYSGGDGGSAVFTDSIPLGSDLIVSVGGGGGAQFGSTPAGIGGTTSVGTLTAAGGGHSRSTVCTSATPSSSVGAGAYGIGDAATCTPGAGMRLSDIGAADLALFPASADDADPYAGGGAALNGTNPSRPGQGGTGLASGGVTGGDGIVVFRFAATMPAPAPAAIAATPTAGPTLATTGSDVSWPAPVLGGVAVAAGAVLLAAARRRSSQR